MGIQDLLKQMGGLEGLASIVASNPQMLAAAASLLNPNDPSVGGSTGLAGLVNSFHAKGLGDVIGSWVGGGPNQSISADQITNVLGSDTLSQFATKAGVDAGNAGSMLATLLPVLVNHLTPNGQVPDGNSLQGALGGLLAHLGQ